MQLAVTFRHMDATEALKEYAHDKVERIKKYFPSPIKAHVVLGCDRGYNHIADVMITLHNGIVIKGEETTEDMYSSIDLVMAKIERQCRRYKEKLQDHRADSLHGQREIVHSFFALDDHTAEPVQTDGHAAEEEGPKIIKKSKFFARPMTTKEAVMQMNLLGNDFLVFTNALSHEVNVVYRRADETYGLIETGQGAASGANPQA